MASNATPSLSSEPASSDLAVDVSSGAHAIQQKPCSESGNRTPPRNSSVQSKDQNNSFSQDPKLKTLAYSALDDLPETSVERELLEYSELSVDNGISDVSLNTHQLSSPVPVSTINSVASTWCSDSPSFLVGVSEPTYPVGVSPAQLATSSEECGDASPSKQKDLTDCSITAKVPKVIEISVGSTSSSSSTDSPFILELPPHRSQCSSDPPLSCASAVLYRQSSGPPPSYSYVMERDATVQQVITRPAYSFIPPVPPPSYAQAHGIFGDPTHFLAVSHTIWGRQPMPALCPQCGTLILTVISKQDSLITHLSAILLCMLGCWPCCLVPYCLDICKNTYHYCPVCRLILGVYNPRRGLS